MVVGTLKISLDRLKRIIKLVKMWPGGTHHVVVGTLKISLDRLKRNKNTRRSLVECCHVSSCE